VNSNLNLRVGEWIEIRSKEEILQTLDKDGRLNGLPCMPEMLQYCGQRFPVYRRAHKTCDTATLTGGRRMESTVHLDGVRCGGAAHGGCQAGCLIFWKEAWLKRVDDHDSSEKSQKIERVGGCTEEELQAATQTTSAEDPREPKYVCQATQLPYASTRLPFLNLSQYVEDYTSGNVALLPMLKGFVYAAYYKVSELGLGLGQIMRWLYDRLHPFWGGVAFPRRRGTIPTGHPTPSCSLNLQAAELVRVKSYQQILATLDTANRNRGLLFDAEMVPFCGETHRVLGRVNQIINEKTGKMMRFKNSCILLEGVVCQSRFTDCKFCPLFCPRAIYSYWREIWLERVPQAGSNREEHPRPGIVD
jgi:hypothetical protein